MFKALTKTRSANFYANQVKVLLLVIIGALVWSNNDARHFTADRLNDAADFVRPANNEHIIKFSF